MKKIFTHLFAVLLLSLVTTSAWAQTTIENGCVYHFQNGAFAGRAITAVEGDLAAVKATDTDPNDIKQLWYAIQSEDNWIFRNLYNGRYLSQTGSNNWGLTDTNTAASNVFDYIVAGTDKNTIRSAAVSDGNGYMHLGTATQDDVVGWSSGAGGSQWVVTKKDYTTEYIASLLATAVSTFPTVAAFQTQLNAIFEDVACTKLKSSYSEMTEEQILADENYKALSTPLRDMVLKVYNEKTGIETAWAEDNADATKHENNLDWSGLYAKKFRVQMYEPYSIAGDITSWLGINAHANNDNPTGIYVPEPGYVYVMVEGEIEDGATLRLVNGGHNLRIGNATGDGYALSPGLNVINYTEAAGMLYVCYNVDTYNPDGTDDATRFPHKLSEYAPLKIHIEGGAVNGYYNACGDFRATSDADNLWKSISGASVDCDADWTYMETRANLNVIPVLAHRQILLFQLKAENGSEGLEHYLPDNISVPETPYSYAKSWSEYGMGCDPLTGKINILMEAWDRVMYSQLATMGLVNVETMRQMNEFYPRWESDHTIRYEMYDYENKSTIDNKNYLEFCGVDYSDVFNHHGVALGTTTNYMYGGWDHCGYNINTFGGIINTFASNAGSTWGPAHEIGHQHQALLTLNGLTEVTNNLFSNIGLWYKGMSTSRYNGSNGSLESVLNAYNTEGSDIYTNNIWALTHLYYRLWLYYHLAGNNTQFYPRLFELLRHDPMLKGYNVSGDVSTLHFYKLACQAAGEDLTEFFRAHGYFSIMDDRLVGDYSNSVYEVSQEMIDEAIAEVKAMRDAEGNPLKENLAIILICDDDENATYVQHDGVTKRDIYGETTSNSDFGSVSDFINGNVSVETTYTATLNSDGTLTMSGGEGGVGFLVLNEDGEIVSFSNKSTFAISDEAAYLLATGKASVVTVDTESTTTEAEVDVTAMRFALLQELIENAIALTQNTSETRVGFYKSSAVENLQEYVTMAQEVIANGDHANLQAVYELLYAEYNAVVANEYSRVTLVPGSKYAILAKTNDRILSFSNTTVVTVAATEDYASTANNHWYIERDGAFHIKNAGNSKYIQNVTDQNGVLYTVGDEVVNMNINEIQLGCYSIATSTVPGRYMNMDGANNARVITWGDTGNNSQWKFILLEENETNAAKEDLLELAKKTLALVDVVGTVEYTEGNKIELQSTNSGNANYIWSNAPESGNNVDKLLDSDKNTFFHSQWNNSTAPTDGWGHHLTVDLGENPSLTSFKFKFTTRNQSNLSNYPKTIEVYGSNVGGNDVANYTKLQAASGFATGAGVDNEVVVMGNGTAYRYLRFLVTDASGSNAGTNTGADGKVFFHMSEFSLYPITVTTSVKSDYTSGVTSDAVMNAFVDAEHAKSVYNNASATIDDINAKKTELGDGADVAGSYTTLLTQYNNVLSSMLNAKKGTLKEWIDKMTDLMKDAGTVNAQGPMSVDLAGKLYAHKPYTAGGESHSDYSSVATNYNLLDSNTNTHFHSDYSSNMPDVPYIRVDLGEGKTINEFTFNYTTRGTGTGYPTTIKVYGGNTEITYDDVKDTEPLATFTTSDANNPMPKDFNSWTSTSIQSATAYRFFVFAVTTSSVNKEYGDVTRPYFVMSEFGFTECGKIIVNLTSNVITEDELLDAYYANSKANKLYTDAKSVAIVEQAITDLQAAYNELYAAMNNTATLKANLKELIDNTQALYDKMADDEGNVNSNYSVSALENQDLVDALAQITAAQLVFENASATVENINTAYETLDEKYQVLLEVENANEKGSLATTELETLIDNTKILLGNIATEEVSNVGIALQIDNETAPYYIWSNAPADDCNEYSNKVQGLIDTNDDGSAKTGTFFGTDWGSSVPAYTHYIEIDMGVSSVLENLSVDYTTRESGAEDSRPNGLKFFGSNNKVDYEEFYSVTTGLPADANTKWAMSAPVELVKNYRYIRIAVSSPHGSCFNMADFNVYTNINYSLNEYYTTATGLGFEDLCLALQSAEDVVARAYLTTAQYNAVFEKLNTCYTTANNVVNDDVTAGRSELSGLIDITKELLALVSTDDDTEFEIPLQCTNVNDAYYLYCNAPGKTNTTWNTTDSTGVKSLLDDNADTYLHTTYEGNDYADDLDHYLRLDMGKDTALVSFKFDYVGRVNNTGNAPTAIKIEGSNDCENFEEITTLTGLPTANNATYESGEITNGKAYRYIRFMVTATSNGADYNEHPYFALSHFAVTAGRVIAINEEYVTPNLPLKVVTDAYNEVYEANNVVNHYTMSESNLSVAESELQAAYNALNLAKKLPVTLTTDQNNPVLYKIRINRGSTKLLQYDTETAMVAVADEDLGNEYQAWYFMQGTDGNGYDDVLIYPYWGTDAANTTLRLGSNSITDGNSKVSAVDGTDDTYKQNWYITFTEGTTAEGWLNIQPEGKATYFSNHGGTDEKMGFLNKADDDGSQFQFVLDETDYSLSDAYYALLKQYNSYSEIEGGTAVGTYTTESVNAYMEKYNAAGALVEAKNATDDEYNAAREGLVTAYEALVGNMPDPAKYYVLRCNHEGRYIYVNADNKLQWAASSYDKAQSRAVWQFEDIDASNGTCKMKSLHTMSYLNQLVDDQWTFDEETGKVVTIVKSPTVDGAVIFKIEGHSNEGLHAHGANNSVIAHTNEAGANHYFFEEVEVVTTIKHDVTMKTKFSSVTLGYNATVPAGVEAYNAEGLKDGYVTLVKVEGEVIPANTPVILYRTDGDSEAKTFTFTYTDKAAEKPASTLLGGSLYTKYVECDNSDYYKLMIKNGEAKMYIMYKEFNAQGVSQGATHAGGHIKCSANKIYMRVPAAQGVASYGMRFVDYGTTDIDDAKRENQDAETIYDLQGRKLSEITEPGFYIVDGKKVYVK